MSKKLVTNICGKITDWYLERILIEDAIIELNLHKDSGATHLELDSDYDKIVIALYKEREETDEEYRKRLHQESRDMDYIKNNELKLLAKLKAKYPDS